jgi:hypothetical protein
VRRKQLIGLGTHGEPFDTIPRHRQPPGLLEAVLPVSPLPSLAPTRACRKLRHPSRGPYSCGLAVVVPEGKGGPRDRPAARDPRPLAGGVPQSAVGTSGRDHATPRYRGGIASIE